MIKHRITCGLENSLLTEKQASYLINGEPIEDKLSNKWGQRCEILFFCSVKSLLRNEIGVGSFFRYWGGEAIYVGDEDDDDISDQLKAIGKPCIVKCAIPFSDMDRSPNLSHHMLSYYILHGDLSSFDSRVSNLDVDRYYAFDVILKRNTRGEEVIDVIDINHEDFHKLTGYKYWRSF